MRRLSVRYARPGMVLGWPVFDSHGNVVLETGAKLTTTQMMTLIIYGVGELLVEDPRMGDVPVQPLIPAELEGEVVQSLRLFLTESLSSGALQDVLLEEVERPVRAMARELYPEVIGEIMPIGCLVTEEYSYVQPVKTAGLAMLLGKRAGWPMEQAVQLGMAALLLDVGAILRFPSQGKATPPAEDHPRRGAELLGRCPRLAPPIVQAVLQHHARWDGSGYPEGLHGPDIHPFARVLALADSFYELASARPDRQALLPHQAVEYIMAYNGEYFDPAVVKVFARQVPLYPSGVLVKLSTGEAGIVSDPNYGHVGRPVIRICYNERGRELLDTYDIDLSEPEHQNILIERVMEY